MAKYNRKKPKNSKRHMKVNKRSYIPKRIRYVDEYHTKMYMTSNGDQQYTLTTPSWANFASNSITFKLADLLNINLYTKLFEEIRINKIHISIKPSVSQIVTLDGVTANVSAASTAIPTAYYLIDRNDNDQELNADDYKEYSKTVSKLATQSHSVLFTPSTLSPVFAGTDTTGNPIFTYCVDYEKKWIQLNSQQAVNDTTYYGFKMGIEGSDHQVFTLTPTICAYVSFRGKRE